MKLIFIIITLDKIDIKMLAISDQTIGLKVEEIGGAIATCQLSRDTPLTAAPTFFTG